MYEILGETLDEIHKATNLLFLVTRQHIQGPIADFPAFIASKYFDLENRHISQIKYQMMRHIMMY